MVKAPVIGSLVHLAVTNISFQLVLSYPLDKEREHLSWTRLAVGSVTRIAGGTFTT